ncbi:UBA/THiF-type NAD/FAD binding protein [Nitzschia inconspicua]|uniref:E1 ubiquitin-activating enzyme n=1 Tax=Nitzschia inconspicua TaxID=303405 RepID=A0A9K3L0T8_9STRA|nr:UBA/THiF-type NAD/FAD binding protein [Nitzschia inconspicua]
MSAEDTAPMEASATAEVDEKLYSRQLYVMGHEAQRRMMASKALLVGCSGLGVEVAKNCILAGIHSLVLVDPLPPNTYDLGGNFYLTSDDVVKGEASRADICRPQLAELNPYVTVSVASEVTELTSEQLLPLLDTGVTCIVITIPLPRDLLIQLDNKCRSVGASFVYSLTCGAFGKVFCDFEGDKVVIKVLEDQGRHGLESGDMVTFARLKGIPGSLEINKNYKVHVTGPFTFEIEGETVEDATEGHAQQGYITQVKQPVTIPFESYEKRLAEPGEMMMSDFAKFDRPPLLHKAFQALEDFRTNQNGGEFPSPGDADACQNVLNLVKAMVAAANEDPLTPAQERIVLQLASGSKAVLSPMCAAIGGIVGQEVLKACSGKFSPINGFFFLDADETLPDDLLPADQVAPQNVSRYDSQIAVYGKDMQEKLLDLNYFIVGAGAIGCEMLKNWALMGVGCGPKGHVIVTDMDRIEKSNLSRQFLFRNKDIDHFKSSTAANAAKVMNPDLKITALQEKVAPDTEDIFGDDFFDKLSGVCTALDNVEARLYVDQRCVFYRLPMLESGTLGTKGNTQIVVPHLTENYGATRDPPEKSIPVCTLKNFPNQIQHTLQWARDYFEGEFKQSAEDVNSYLGHSPEEYLASLQPNTKTETLKKIRKTLVDERPMSFEDCVSWARLKFEDLFNNQIRQLLHNFPEDQVTSSGAKFWSGSKRCPKPLTFDINDKCEDAEMFNHLDFVVAAANLRATMYGIKGRTDKEYFEGVLKDVIVPDFTPQDGVKIAANDEEEKDGNDMDTGDAEADELWNSLPKQADLAGFQLTPIDFDKDLDDHMLFVTSCSNLRAMNYSIPTEDTHRSRAIAGRIIPAIATTTALVTGLVCMELYKIIGTPRKELSIEAYKNGFLNLAVPFMTLSEPTPPKKTKCMLKGKEWEWTAWDSLDMNLGDITMGEFMDHFENEYNLEISMLSYGVSILYSFFANKKKVEERKAMKMTEVIHSITKKEFPPNQLFIVLEVIANDKETDEEVELPYIKFRFR